ncbi:MAG TPA: universal stress protein, partial [Methanomassiliicoccales archaeon]|nr:universal stress protein [Methanomassiliicoccales archaeon]
MNVLVATDGRAHSEKAVEYAFLLARAFRARLFVIYVV